MHATLKIEKGAHVQLSIQRQSAFGYFLIFLFFVTNPLRYTATDSEEQCIILEALHINKHEVGILMAFSVG